MKSYTKVNKSYWMGVDTEFDLFGRANEFNLSITKADTGERVTNGVPTAVSELMWNITTLSVEVTGDVNVRGAFIPLASTAGISVGDRFTADVFTHEVGPDGVIIATDVSHDNDFTYGDDMIIEDGNTLEVGDGATVEVNGLNPTMEANVVGDIYYVIMVTENGIYLKNGVAEQLTAGSVLHRVGNTGIYKIEILLDTVGEYIIKIEHELMGHAAQKLLVGKHELRDIDKRSDAMFITKKGMKTIV